MGAGDYKPGFSYLPDRRSSSLESRNRREPKPVIIDRYNWPVYEAAGWFHVRNYPNDQELIERAVVEAEEEYGVGKVAISGPWDEEHSCPAGSQGVEIGLYAQRAT